MGSKRPVVGDVKNERHSMTTSGLLGVNQPLAIPEKWNWHHRKLVALRDRLFEERQRQLADVTERVEAPSMHLADAASDQAEHDLALATLSAEQDVLYEIDEALRRIQNDSYGVCEATGQPIGEKRLRAIPWTRFSEEAELNLEKQSAVSHAHLGALNSVREPPRRLRERVEPNSKRRGSANKRAKPTNEEEVQ